jgi:hypothetical protein
MLAVAFTPSEVDEARLVATQVLPCSESEVNIVSQQ